MFIFKKHLLLAFARSDCIFSLTLKIFVKLLDFYIVSSLYFLSLFSILLKKDVGTLCMTRYAKVPTIHPLNIPINAKYGRYAIIYELLTIMQNTNT